LEGEGAAKILSLLEGVIERGNIAGQQTGKGGIFQKGGRKFGGRGGKSPGKRKGDVRERTEYWGSQRRKSAKACTTSRGDGNK